MKDLPVHLLLFVVTCFAITLLGAMFAERSDEKAVRGLPRRLAVFLVGCAVLAGIMLVCEHTFAS